MDNLRTKRNSQKLKVTENTSGGVMAEEKVQVYAPGSVYPRFRRGSSTICNCHPGAARSGLLVSKSRTEIFKYHSEAYKSYE